jgi:hypothetical protein
MTPKKRKQSAAIPVIPPNDPNTQLSFAGNHMSIVSKADLLYLVEIGVLPPKELCSWRIWHGVTVPTEDTHEAVIFVPFLIWGLALPVSPFFHGLLDFYSLNLTHLNPNSVFQIAVFIHLCEAFIGIFPHFGLWKYLYHCRSGMAGGQHQLVGGASLELCRGRKVEYLDIPLKDNIKGWQLEWFTMENHNKSLLVRSGRQPDVRTPSWTEVPTDSKIAEYRVLLAEICALKDRGLTTKAVFVGFVFKNIQPLKDRVYPAYLYTGVNDPTRITSKHISKEDVLSQVDLMLRCKASNVGTPFSCSAWNLSPQIPFSKFVSNPPVQDDSPGHRVRPSPEDIEAFIAPYQNLPEEERQTHLQVQTTADEAEVNVVLSMLVGELSDSVRTELVSAARHVLVEDEGTHSPGIVRRKRLCRMSHPAASAEGKKRKKRLRRSSGLELGADCTISVLGDGSASANLEDDIENCDGARVGGRALDEDEEEVLPLIRKNSRSQSSDDVPIQALSGLVSLWRRLSLRIFY